ncbi:MAG TPA: SRPBCC family protein [Phenylobacterium sp.]|jgi:uncharacterized protein YndB with AHSA1/START domain|uniref:SRPBCC family protein n=1 Tax=Phenylobacterium sp. TaxID=1871053 RepID=UPI002D5B7093|nr:SRPBCC family protein [Phenylobacterium sp.]HZZ67516.1 SRPBCC family protein [Phenylobacterium sp.]
MTGALIDDALGEVRKVGDTYEVIFERRLKRPIEKVWAAITVPERIAEWFTEATVDLRIGGTVTLNWPEDNYRMSGVIIELDPPRLFAWTWPHEQHPDSVVRWELSPDGDGCRLTLTQTGMVDPVLRSVAAGWHTYLECLAGGVDGIHTPWQAAREAALLERYKAVALPG